MDPQAIAWSTRIGLTVGAERHGGLRRREPGGVGQTMETKNVREVQIDERMSVASIDQMTDAE